MSGFKLDISTGLSLVAISIALLSAGLDAKSLFLSQDQAEGERNQQQVDRHIELDRELEKRIGDTEKKLIGLVRAYQGDLTVIEFTMFCNSWKDKATYDYASGICYIEGVGEVKFKSRLAK